MTPLQGNSEQMMMMKIVVVDHQQQSLLLLMMIMIIIIVVVVSIIIIIIGHHRHQEINQFFSKYKIHFKQFYGPSKTSKCQKTGNGNISSSSVSALQVDLLAVNFLALQNSLRVGVSKAVLFPQGVCSLQKLSLGGTLLISKESWRRKHPSVGSECSISRCQQALSTSHWEKNPRNPPMMLASTPEKNIFNSSSSRSSLEAGPARFLRTLTIPSVGVPQRRGGQA